MTILLYIEHAKGQISKSALVAIRAALVAKEVHRYTKAVGLLLGGDDCSSAAAEAARYGLDEIIVAKSAALTPYLAAPYALALKQILASEKPALILALASSQGKDLMPRVAQLQGAGQASDVIAFLPDGHYRRPMYAGNVFAEVEITTPCKVVTVRGSAFEPATQTSATTPIREVEIRVERSNTMEFVSFDTVASARPELTEASIVVSGGRAMKSAENFEKYIYPLADVLGAAVGASRAAVDSGFAPNDWQVGQTGKVVAPSLYIAVGISGAIQHLAGMKDSKVIVAINKDPEAPIFEIADYGLVADLYQALPELVEELKKVIS